MPVFVAVQAQSALLDPVPWRVAKGLQAVIRPAVESDRRFLVDVLELLLAQSPALHEAAGNTQLPALPFPEDLTDPLRAEGAPPTRARREGDSFPSCSTSPIGSRALLSRIHSHHLQVSPNPGEKSPHYRTIP